jgi:NAD(P)-dependent dehydrogenase (short-subunit alcohol dehydrogenase family)
MISASSGLMPQPSIRTTRNREAHDEEVHEQLYGMTNQHIGHVTLLVRDYDEAKAWYCVLPQIGQITQCTRVYWEQSANAEALSAVQAAMDAFGRLDVVVNNAGDIAPFEQLSSEIQGAGRQMLVSRDRIFYRANK